MKRNIGLYVALGTIMMVLLGIVYSYSMFRIEIQSYYQIESFESGLPYMLSLFFYALFMALGGRWFQQFSTTVIALVGTILIGGGFILAAIWTPLYGLVISYGVLIGSGVGILYGLPLRIISQLPVSKPGLFMGITLMGFGLSPLIFAPIVNNLIESNGLHTTFLILGVTYSILLVLLFLPLARYDHVDKTSVNFQYPMMKEPSFYLVYAVFFIGTLIGLTIIGFTGNIGVERIMLTEESVSVYLGLFAVLNGIGRPLYGYLNDRLGFVRSASINFIMLTIASILLLFSGDHIVLFALSFAVIYVSFGGWLSLAPGATIQLFGAKDYSKNYGVMFTAYGFGALLGSALGGLLVDHLGYVALFAMLGTFALFGLILIQWKQSYIIKKS